MPIKIHNSLTKKKEELKPVSGKVINMYSCGVTVYDKCHIGHARSLYIFNLISRYLRQHCGYKVNFVRNITDVDDKIINKANELNKPWKEVAQENIDAYYQDLERLDIDKADIEPRATDNIPEMINHIQGLIEKGHAYEVNGDVYFNIRKFKDYGRLSGQSIEKMLEAVRIDPILKKKDPLDFALWKKSKEGEPAWDSPWGKGRPGWHIECSVMSLKHLNCETLDIHAGGRDLIFPHHENEIAQAEALTGKPFARCWIHHGLLTINGQKMAKSLGNFITIEEVLEKYPSDILKLFYLHAHYSSSIDFSWEKMEEAKRAYERIQILISEIKKRYVKTTKKDIEKVKVGIRVELIYDEFIKAMDDDFNTPQAQSWLFAIVSECNQLLDKNDEKTTRELSYALDYIRKMVDILGLIAIEDSHELTEEQKRLLSERVKARESKDFKRSDEIREQLKNLDVIVEDSKYGQRWRKA